MSEHAVWHLAKLPANVTQRLSTVINVFYLGFQVKVIQLVNKKIFCQIRHNLAYMTLIEAHKSLRIVNTCELWIVNTLCCLIYNSYSNHHQKFNQYLVDALFLDMITSHNQAIKYLNKIFFFFKVGWSFSFYSVNNNET